MEFVGIPPWEQSAFRAISGDTLRPGGFALTDRAAEYIGVVPGWRVLDVGCGLGATVQRLRARYGADAFGVDASASQLERVPFSAGMIRATGESLPFVDAVFQAIFCECVLSLFKERGTGLKECHRTLAPGGFLVLSDLSSSTPGKGRADSCANRAVSVREMLEALESAGFEAVLVEDHTACLRQMAAAMVWSGAGHVGGCDSGRRLGYHLIVARKTGERHAE